MYCQCGNGVTLTLISEEISAAGAFLNIFGDSGNQIGTTSASAPPPAICRDRFFQYPRRYVQCWAADGMVQFMVQPNPVMVLPGVPGDGINPCDPAVVDADGEVEHQLYFCDAHLRRDLALLLC